VRDASEADEASPRSRGPGAVVEAEELEEEGHARDTAAATASGACRLAYPACVLPVHSGRPPVEGTAQGMPALRGGE
jgi:hypothetical protein